MTTKQTILGLVTIAGIILICGSSCSLDRRRYSTYRDEKGMAKTEHYNQYKRKWYRKTWYNRQIWK